jgi:hypothetical protein
MNSGQAAALPKHLDSEHSWVKPVVQRGDGSCHLREDTMRRPLLLIAAATIAACGGSTNESQPASPYDISVASSSHSGGGGVTPYIASISLLVTDTGTGIPHQGVGVTLQVDGGDITSPVPNITDANGLTSVTWAIDTSLQDAGATYTLAYCAVRPGKTFCKTSLGGADIVQAQF